MPRRSIKTQKRKRCLKHDGISVTWNPKKQGSQCPLCEAESERDSLLLSHNTPSLTFVTQRVKPLAELTGDDVPPGIDPYDLATDYP